MLAAQNKNLGRTLLLVCYILLMLSALTALIAGNSFGALAAAMGMLAAAGGVCLFAVQV